MDLNINAKSLLNNLFKLLMLIYLSVFNSINDSNAQINSAKKFNEDFEKFISVQDTFILNSIFDNIDSLKIEIDSLNSLNSKIKAEYNDNILNSISKIQVSRNLRNINDTNGIIFCNSDDNKSVLLKVSYLLMDTFSRMKLNNLILFKDSKLKSINNKFQIINIDGTAPPKKGGLDMPTPRASLTSLNNAGLNQNEYKRAAESYLECIEIMLYKFNCKDPKIYQHYMARESKLSSWQSIAKSRWIFIQYIKKTCTKK